MSFWTPMQRRMVLWLGGMCVAGTAFLGSGCGLVYKNSLRERCFTLYSDRSEEYLKRVAGKIERIYKGLGELFEVSEDRLGHPAILLEGEDSDVVDLRHSPDILGYYLPFLNLISVDSTEDPRENETLDQVLLHEIAHHFIVTEWPSASSECWLNEGLAGALEVSLFDNDGFEFPLLNPVLGQIAHNAVYGREELPRLAELLTMSWSQFHDREQKEHNYALAWALVYFLLEREFPPEMPLGDKIDALYRLDRTKIAEREPEWSRFLRAFDLNGRLLDLARLTGKGTRLTALWAIETAGHLRSGEDLRMLEGFAHLFDSGDLEVRIRAYVAFTHKLDLTSHSYVREQDAVRDGIERVARALTDVAEPRSLRLELAHAMGDCRRTQAHWVPRLVNLLASSDGELRAAAAAALSRLTTKPTIVNPGFWREGTTRAREAEVAEWRAWLVTGSGDG